MYRLICMSFDGEYQTERPTFKTIEDAWEYSNDLGSKWYFYPFHFVTSESGKTIKDSPYPLTHLIGVRTKSVANLFCAASEREDMQGVGVVEFVFNL